MITGYGVAESVRHYYDLFRGSDLRGKRAIIQGWGNVASAAACYLAVEGVKIVGIIDRDGGIIRPDGMGLDEVKELFLHKKGNKLQAEGTLSFEETNERIWSVGAEIFIPGAASKLVSRTQVDAMLANGLEVISCGANVPFVDDGVFFGPTALFADQHLSLIPDFIANCGMARVFAYLMQPDAEMTDEAIFSDVSNIIRQALKEVHGHNILPTNIASAALEIALNKLMKTQWEEAV